MTMLSQRRFFAFQLNNKKLKGGRNQNYQFYKLFHEYIQVKFL